MADHQAKRVGHNPIIRTKLFTAMQVGKVCKCSPKCMVSSYSNRRIFNEKKMKVSVDQSLLWMLRILLYVILNVY